MAVSQLWIELSSVSHYFWEDYPKMLRKLQKLAEYDPRHMVVSSFVGQAEDVFTGYASGADEIGSTTVRYEIFQSNIKVILGEDIVFDWTWSSLPKYHVDPNMVLEFIRQNYETVKYKTLDDVNAEREAEQQLWKKCTYVNLENKYKNVVKMSNCFVPETFVEYEYEYARDPYQTLRVIPETSEWEVIVESYSKFDSGRLVKTTRWNSIGSSAEDYPCE